MSVSLEMKEAINQEMKFIHEIASPMGVLYNLMFMYLDEIPSGEHKPEALEKSVQIIEEIVQKLRNRRSLLQKIQEQQEN